MIEENTYGYVHGLTRTVGEFIIGGEFDSSKHCIIFRYKCNNCEIIFTSSAYGLSKEKRKCTCGEYAKLKKVSVYNMYEKSTVPTKVLYNAINTG